MNHLGLAVIPWSLTAVRLLLAPVLIAVAVTEVPRLWYASILAVAFWFDIMDGVLARRLGVDTPAFRRFDSRCDVLFFIAVLVAIGIAEPGIAIELLPLSIGLLSCEAACQVVSYARFRCGTSAHSWLCKAWAIGLFYAAARVLIASDAGGPVYAVLAFGFVAYADAFAILLIARKTPVDVPSAWHAWQAFENNRSADAVETETERAV